MTSIRQRVARIREIVRTEYNYWTTYNDKVKTGRRIKMMRNGFTHGPAMYLMWDRNIKRKLRRAGIEYQTAGFEQLERPFYGSYMAYVVRIGG